MILTLRSTWSTGLEVVVGYLCSPPALRKVKCIFSYENARLRTMQALVGRSSCLDILVLPVQLVFPDKIARKYISMWRFKTKYVRVGMRAHA